MTTEINPTITRILPPDPTLPRCRWCLASEKMIRYHDEDWGTPMHDDRKLFAFLMLEVMQCGLSWRLVVEKKEIFEECFDQFDIRKVAAYGPEDEDRILNHPGMVRSKRKIHAIVKNAGCVLKIIEEFGSFDHYLWSYTDHKTIRYSGHEKDGIMISKNDLSERIAKDLKKRGFSYVGAVTVYSFLQANGMVNDHTGSCFLYDRLNESCPFIQKDPEGDV